ncbi:MAG: DUF445 domain-containing protein [Sphingobacteriales bacterium]|jgi:uncharacterized membrane protein YheB (UPF0754 family)
MNLSYILIPLISAFIGYFTNWIAIKMLFHPKLPIRVLGITVQGIFPKRQKQFAEKLGSLISNEFLSFQDIEQKIANPSNLKKVLPEVEKHVDQFLHHKLSELFPMISMFIGEKTISSLKFALMAELESIFPVIMSKYVGELKQDLDLEQIVIEKVSAFSSDQLEDMLYKIMSKEFRMVEILGGVLGFIIGIIQVIIAALMI